MDRTDKLGIMENMSRAESMEGVESEVEELAAAATVAAVKGETRHPATTRLETFRQSAR